MSMLQPTKDLLKFLNSNPSVRARISAPPNATLLYAGNFFRPIWQDVLELKRANPDLSSKRTLPEVLSEIYIQRSGCPTLLHWAKSIDQLEPWKSNGFIAWKALSGIFASNAKGAVSFAIGSNITKNEKIFAATELTVLLKNPNVDTVTKDVLAYYQRCIEGGQTAINFGLIR